MTIAEKPFSIDLTTLRRHDGPKDYIAFRESAINLLIYQDFGDLGRIPSIKFFKDKIIFWNPGDAFNYEAELLEPRSKEVRNPSIVNAFRRIGLSDQAGTGVPTIFRTWRDAGNVPPQVISNKADKFFQLTLLIEELLSEEQLLFQASIGVHLSEIQADVSHLYARMNGSPLQMLKLLLG
jgi:ATP-dependent DNA helicase RecG